MTIDNTLELAPGDYIKAHNDVFQVAGYPERVVFERKRMVRLTVKDDFGRTRVITNNDIEKRLKKAA